jgi:hypothetical protein
MTQLVALTAALTLLSGAPRPDLTEGKVTLSAEEWKRMLDQLEAIKKPDPASVLVAPIARKIEGSFRKGLLTATLTARFEVLSDAGHVRVPVLDGGASIGEVTLNKKRTSLLREGELYTVGVDRPGSYEVTVRFFYGREQDRFARRLALRLPEAGATEIAILIPEQEIEPRLAHGALSSEQRRGEGTELIGHLDPTGLLDLSWSRKLSHKGEEKVRLETKLDTVLTIHEALVSGRGVFDVNVLEGEADRIDFDLPEEVEVVKVEGDAVLQWRTEADPTHKGKLAVLLRYLVEGHTKLVVHYQFPIEQDKALRLRMPMPKEGVPLDGAAGIQAPAGLNVKLERAEKATELSTRDVPAELTDLSQSPLLLAFRFSESPLIQLLVARHKEVELNSTLVDETQASTVIIESGIEVTKLKLRIRNNTRQYLTMRLPEGAVLTHSLIDGQAVRPAVMKDAQGREALLLPLRQSERITGGERLHVVREGETLSDISNIYFSDPSQWRAIQKDNLDQLGNSLELQVGQRLKVRSKKGATVEESAFTIELAYKRERPPLGIVGKLALELPEVDVDTMTVIWHLYLPDSLAALDFDANLTQYSGIRYDPFRRIKSYLEEVLGMRNAWAGAGGYQSILAQRKVIWRAEAEKRAESEVVLSSFPLVGERYRFRRILLGKETPHIELGYVKRGLAGVARWAALIATFLLTLLMLGSRRRPAMLWVAAGALLLMLIEAHFFLGVHRRMLWGIDLGLLFILFRPRVQPVLTRLGALLRSPWEALELIRIKNALILLGLLIVTGFVLMFPLLLSSSALVVLSIAYLRRARSGALEVGHAA